MYVTLTFKFSCVFLVGMMRVISCIGLVMSCYVIILIGTINVCACKSMIRQSIRRKSVILSVVPLAACKLNTHLCVRLSTKNQRVNNICICYVGISDDISTHADFQVDGYHGCWVLPVRYPHSEYIAGRDNDQ